MDVFCEQLVLRKKSAAESIYKYGVIALAAMLIVFLVVFGVTFFAGSALGVLIFIPLLAAVGVFYLAKKMYGALDIEFEYSLTNGQFDIDKIINRNDRKRMITFECAEVERFDKFDSSVSTDNYSTRIFAANADSDSLYYFVVNSQDNGKTIVIIEPNEKVLNGIKHAIPRQMSIEVFGRN